MQEIGLVYASIAVPGLRYRELTSILELSHERNGREGITGILCYGSGRFLQALEGEGSAVDRLYQGIVGDRRHMECKVLKRGAIDSRSFVEWSMTLIGLDDLPTARRRALLCHHTGSDEFDPARMSGDQAEAFLRDLAEMERTGLTVQHP